MQDIKFDINFYLSYQIQATSHHYLIRKLATFFWESDKLGF